MHLECPHCRAKLRVPDSLRRYYDMPVRCRRCRHVFTVRRHAPHDDSGPAHDHQQPLDRSVSARQSHHPTRCHRCGASLLVPGQRTGRHLTGGPLDLTCPYCQAGFSHDPSCDAALPDRLIIGLIAAILTGCAVLWGQHKGYIQLRNLGDSGLIFELQRMLGALAARLQDLS